MIDMKNLLKVLFPAAILLTACGETEKDNPETNDQTDVSEMETLDYTGMSMYDFSNDNVDLPFKMMLPLKTEGDKPKITHTEDVTWGIKLDEKFNIVIEDWGTEEKTIEKQIEDLKGVGPYNFSTVEKDDDELIYKYSVGDGEGQETIEFSHFVLIKKIGDTYYTFQSAPMGSFSVARIKTMLRASKSFQPAQEA